MESTVKAPKLAKTTHGDPQNGEDRISNLPEHIIYHILSFLKTFEVIRTRALSRRWRYLWTSIPYLDFDVRPHYPNMKSQSSKESFKEFVYWVLASGSSDLQRFHLCCSNYYEWETVVRWIRIASWRRVKELELTFCPCKAFHGPKIFEPDCVAVELPHSLVTCESLQKLTLCLVKCALKLPQSIGFNRLTSLTLVLLELSDESFVRNFLAGCPLLEHLRVHSCILNKLKVFDISSPKLKSLEIKNFSTDEHLVFEDGLVNSVLKVSCPNLTSFDCFGHMALDYSLEDLSSLEKGYLYFLPPIYERRSSREKIQEVGYCMCKILTSLSHANFLSLSTAFLLYFKSVLREPRCFSASLHNLKSLRLCTEVNDDCMEAVLYLLNHSPNLESLVLSIQKTCKWNDYWGLDDKKIRLLTCHLKRVQFLDFRGEDDDLSFIGFLLEFGDILDEMIFRWRTWKAHGEKSAETIQHISTLFMSSSAVKLTFLDPGSRLRY